jgi:hypothetical protein
MITMSLRGRPVQIRREDDSEDEELDEDKGQPKTRRKGSDDQDTITKPCLLCP